MVEAFSSIRRDTDEQTPRLLCFHNMADESGIEPPIYEGYHASLHTCSHRL
jgi:hypothetical protein